MSEADAIAEKLASKEWRMSSGFYLILPEDDDNGNMVPFILRDEQAQFLRERHARNFVPKARKLGMSTLIVIDYLDECVWHENTHCAHVDFREDDAAKKLKIARFAWENGPRHPDKGLAEIWKALHEKVKLVKCNDSALEWSNGSKQEASMSFMGGTPRRLHVSEFGPMAAQRPETAQKIKRGSFNALGKSGILDVETTMEGGKFGECYELFKLALEAKKEARPLSRLDWKMHFFPWFNHPSYILTGYKPSKESTFKYFKELQDTYGLVIPPDRQAWYEIKAAEQKDDMFTQFPSVEAECVMSKVAGAIYPYVTTLRTRGRVSSFEAERSSPIFTAWDIGVSDYLSGWCVQPAGRELLWLGWFEEEGKGAADVVQAIRDWEAMFGKKMAMNYFPHDANIREKSNAKTYVDALKSYGLPSTSIRVVPRTPDVWRGIEALRDLLPKSWFHSRTDETRRDELGTDKPSGLQCLEAYRKAPPSPSGIVRDTPLHDRTSHTADAARTFAEAWGLGLVPIGYEANHESTRKPRVFS